MQLYYFPGAIAVASAITLQEAGLKFEPVLVDFTKAEQTKSGYHAVNPKGRVPSLVTDQGILTETGAIAEYVSAMAPQAGLVPQDPWQAAQMRAVMCYLASTMHVAHAHMMRGSRWARQESSFADMQSKVAENMADCCAYLENGPFKGPYTLGKTISLADPWLFTVCTWLEGDGVDIAAYPKLAAFYELMQTRPSVRAIKELGILA